MGGLEGRLGFLHPLLTSPLLDLAWIKSDMGIVFPNFLRLLLLLLQSRLRIFSLLLKWICSGREMIIVLVWMKMKPFSGKRSRQPRKKTRGSGTRG
jgi:hypothetical protein